MTYRIVAHPRVQKEIEKLFKKDKVRYEYIKKETQDTCRTTRDWQAFTKCLER